MSDTIAGDADPQTEPPGESGQAAPAADERLAYRGVFQRLLIRPEIGAALGAIAIWTFFWAVSVPFGKAGGAASILDVASSPLGIMAVAVAMLMIGGEFDLSTGAATGAFGIIMILMVRDVVGDAGGWGLSLWWALPLSLAAAITLGWFNGTVVDRTGLPSFIVTLASFFVLKGAKLGFSKQLVDQIQTGKLDDLIIAADQERLVGLRLIDEADGARQQELLNSVGVTMDTPVEGLEAGNGTFSALLDAVRAADANDNARELEQLAELSRPFIERPDKGYSTLNDIFAYDWLRNEHIWEWRDWAYMLGAFLGLSLLVLAMYEMHFRRKPSVDSSGVLPLLGGVIVAGLGVAGGARLLSTTIANPIALILAIAASLAVIGIGLSILRSYRDRANAEGLAAAIKSLMRNALVLPGVALALVGMWRLHATDSVSGNTIGAILIGAGMLVALIGWGSTRYVRRASLSDAAQQLGDASDDFDDASSGSVAPPFVTGVVALALGMFLARRMDADNSTNLVVEWDLSGWAMFLIAIVVAGLAAFLSAVRGDTVAAELSAGETAVSRALSVLIGTAGQRMRTAGILTFIVTMLFLAQATIQGARAIFFMLLLGVAAVSCMTGVRRARNVSHPFGSLLLFIVAVLVAGTAFFIRAESMTPKFRTQMFSVLLAVAALMAIWAVATLIFQERSGPDHDADGLGRGLAVAGGLALAVGLFIRLLAVTQAEVVAGITPTRFSVRILWFLAFTAIATWVLGRTRFGSWIFAVGGNKDASRQVGVPASRTKTQLFMITAVAAWLVGLLLAFRLNTIQASTGDGEEFEYIIAAVVGGNALTGGRGSTLGAAIGAFIMAMSVQGIPSARWNSDWRFVFVGVILLLAVIANNYIRTQAEQAR